jgi:uncharacterized protein YdcH (DUF465 family)
MPENIDDLKKLELLNEARRILNTEYNKKKSDDYNNWLLKNSNAIKSTNFHLPFPPFVVGNDVPFYVAKVPMPTEHEVVAKAIQLYNARYNVATTATATDSVPEVREEVSVPETEEKIMEEVEHVQEEINEKSITDVEPTVLEDSELAGLQLRDAMIQEIYNIYGDQEIKDYVPKIEQTVENKIIFPEAALNAVPQPLEELAKLKPSNSSFASIYQKFQSMKDNLISPTNKGST